MSGVTLQAAYVLHRRPFRDSSVIADLLTPDHGRVSVVARGARSAKSKRRVLLQPFRPVLASWSGRSNLRTLGTMEEAGMPVPLADKPLACAYYVTELALRLIPEDLSNVTAFALYARTLPALNEEDGLDVALRLYELGLLDSLGLLPDFAHCDVDGGNILSDCVYRFDPESGLATRSQLASGSFASGPFASGPGQASPSIISVTGKTLLALASQNLQDSDVLPEAKRIMRRIVQLHLGGFPLKSREVFSQLSHGRES